MVDLRTAIRAISSFLGCQFQPAPIPVARKLLLDLEAPPQAPRQAAPCEVMGLAVTLEAGGGAWLVGDVCSPALPLVAGKIRAFGRNFSSPESIIVVEACAPARKRSTPPGDECQIFRPTPTGPRPGLSYSSQLFGRGRSGV
jgi:hypothetical protein